MCIRTLLLLSLIGYTLRPKFHIPQAAELKLKTISSFDPNLKRLGDAGSMPTSQGVSSLPRRSSLWGREREYPLVPALSGHVSFL